MSKVVASVRLASHHEPTGGTVHRVGNDVLPPPAELRIAQYGSDPGFTLLYLDSDLNEMTDTYHDTLEAAFGQATFELGVAPADWTILRD